MAGRRAKSKASSSTRHSNELTFILDECLACKVVREALEQAGLRVSSVDELFGRGVKDLDWMPMAGAAGHVVVTRDNTIRRNKAERDSYINAPIRGFFLAARGSLRGEEMAAILARHAKQMQRAAQVYDSPFIAIVRKDSVEVLDTEDCPRVKIPRRHRKT